MVQSSPVLHPVEAALPPRAVDRDHVADPPADPGRRCGEGSVFGDDVLAAAPSTGCFTTANDRQWRPRGAPSTVYPTRCEPAGADRPASSLTVGGREILNADGQETERWRPRELRVGGHQICFSD
jgi:hypothetical protein